jgi:nicotinate-nucleotide--dimethylbenzimidazole phosphoribosyltransferase
MALPDALIAPTADPALERTLRANLAARVPPGGRFGQLAEVAVRLGLIQRSAAPRFVQPSLHLFAADHGLAVDGAGRAWSVPTSQRAMLALQGRLPSALLARLHGLSLAVVDCGMADDLPAHPMLQTRKVAHGSRNPRIGPAMSREQVQSALRVGMELAEAHPGNAMAVAAIGQGAPEVGALLLARLDDTPVDALLHPYTDPGVHQAAQAALSRHPASPDPIDALAALGGHDIATMAGALLAGAARRRLLLVDGLAACAALRVASRLAPAITDYVLFCRSSDSPGLDTALRGFQAGALLELGLDSLDGEGATLAWPLVRSAAALLSDGHDLPR